MQKNYKKSKFFVLGILIFTMAFGTGCAQKSPDPVPTEAPKVEAPKVEEVKVEIPKKVFAIGSASSGSLYVTYTAAWADMIMNKMDGMNVVVEPGGSSQNMQTINSGATDFGITASLQSYPGYYGIGWADGTQYQNINSFIPAYSYEGVWFTTAENSDINSIQDLDGKIISFGYAGGGSDFTGREIVEFFGIKPKEIVNASWTDVGGMISDGLVDAVFYLAGHPAAFIQELEVQHDLKFFGLSDEQFSQFKLEKPFYNIGTLKAGTYKGMTNEYKALQGWNFLAISPDLPEDFVYMLTKITWENIADIQAAHVSFTQTDLANVKFMNLPLHPGAEKYYKEMGVELPILPPAPKK